MPIPMLKVNDEGHALSRQLVPLRLACLIADWPPKLLLQMLANERPDELASLGGFEVTKGRVGKGPCSYYKSLLDHLPSDDDRATQLGALPADHCVVSDELADAFTALIDSTLGREDAANAGLELCWTPALLGFEELLSQCPELPPLPNQTTKQTARQGQHEASLKRYRAWWEEFQRLKKANPSTSASSAAGRIATLKISPLPSGKAASSHTIRTVLSRIQTKVSAGIPLTEALQQVLESR
jgi:hypothetical protein